MLAPEEILNNNCFIPESADNNIFKSARKNQKTNFGNEGPSNSRDVTASLRRRIEYPDGENMAAVDRKKKLKCFMPF